MTSISIIYKASFGEIRSSFSDCIALHLHIQRKGMVSFVSFQKNNHLPEAYLSFVDDIKF